MVTLRIKEIVWKSDDTDTISRKLHNGFIDNKVIFKIYENIDYFELSGACDYYSLFTNSRYYKTSNDLELVKLHARTKLISLLSFFYEFGSDVKVEEPSQIKK